MGSWKYQIMIMESKSNNPVIWLFLCFSSFWRLGFSFSHLSLLSLFSLLKGQRTLYEYSPPNPRIRVLLTNAVCVKFDLWVILSFSVFLVFLVILVLLVFSIFSIFPVFSVFVVFSKMLTRPKWLKRMKRLKGHQNH